MTGPRISLSGRVSHEHESITGWSFNGYFRGDPTIVVSSSVMQADKLDIRECAVESPQAQYNCNQIEALESLCLFVLIQFCWLFNGLEPLSESSGKFELQAKAIGVRIEQLLSG